MKWSRKYQWIFQPTGSEVWHYRFMVEAKTYRGTTRLKNEKGAFQVAEKVRQEIVHGRFGILKESPDLPVIEFLEKSFMPFIRTEIKKEKTFEYYEVGVKLLIGSGAFKGVTLSQLTSEHASEFKAVNQHWSPSYRNQGIRTLRRAVRLAYSWRRLDRVPELPKLEKERNRTRVLTREEQESYLSYPHDQRYRIMMMIFFDLGCRPIETRFMDWVNTDWDKWTIKFDISKTDYGERSLPMTDRVRTALLEWWVQCGRPGAGLIFPKGDKWHPAASNEEPVTQRWIDYQHDKFRKKNPCDWTPYAGRHTGLTELGKVTDPFTLKKIAGHSTITVTEKYVHPSDDDVCQAARKRAALRVVGGSSGDLQN